MQSSSTSLSIRLSKPYGDCLGRGWTGGVDKGSVDGVDETIDSRTSMAAIVAGSWCTDREKAAKYHTSITDLCT